MYYELQIKHKSILNKLKHILPINAKTLIYSSLILYHLTFGILVWGYTCERITKLQNKCVRTITTSKYNAHTEPIFKCLNLLKVEDIFKLQVLKFYFKFKKWFTATLFAITTSSTQSIYP